MSRLIVFLLGTSGVGWALAWLADRPGNITVNWQGTETEISVFNAVWISVLLIFLLFISWSIFRTIWHSPAAVGQFFKKRRQARGLDALSSGMIAIGAGDREGATRYAIAARKALPNEPLTHLLRAQAAQLTDDRATSRRIYEGMLGSRDTEALGLRGLFLEAQKEGEAEAALQFAGRALALNSQLGWASDALFDMQCKKHDWPAALETLASARKNGLVEKTVADRRRAVLLTAQAQIAEDDEPDKALALAQEAHSLAPNLVPAADIAGRLLASKGSTAKAAKVLQRTWKRAPHPDLALTYAYARPGDSPRDRLERIKALALLTPHTIEAPIALANTAIEARDFTAARKALKPLLDDRLTQRVCTLMARIEADEHGDAGRVREWLARAVNAPRDPCWTADGITSEQWAPVSPTSGELDAFQWRVPLTPADQLDGAILTQKLEEFVALGAASEPVTDGQGETSAPATAPAPAPPRYPAPDLDQAIEEGAKDVTPKSGRPVPPAVPVAVAAAATATAVTATAGSDSIATATSADETSLAGSQPALERDLEAGMKAQSDAPRGDGDTMAGKGRSQPKTAQSDVIDVEPVTIAATTTDKDTETSAPAAPKTQHQAKKNKTGPAQEAKIFVPPRAPDDPGTEARSGKSRTGSPLTALRGRPVKGQA